MQRVLSARRVADLVDGFDRSPAYLGLAEALRVLIGDGRIPTGVRLPSERELTETLELSRTTVSKAYAELRTHGYLTSRQGSGWVANRPAVRGVRGDALLAVADVPEDAVDLTCAAPLPGPGLWAAYQEALAALPGYLAGVGYYPSGIGVLREAVADHFRQRGLPTTPDQIVIVPGAMAGVAVAANTLLSHGDRVVVENPTYPNAIAALRGRGARLVSSDADDWAADLEDVVRQTRPKAAYLVPDFHNPTGGLRSETERRRVARALKSAGTLAIADESMVQIALDGQEMPAPFAAFHRDTITVGSLSKPFWGGLRVGWMRVPDSLLDATVEARIAMDLGVPPLEQLVATELLHNGAELLVHRREQLRASRAAALDALARHLPDWVPTSPSGGLSLWCRLPAPRSSLLVQAAATHDVMLAPGPSFAPEGGLEQYLRIPYTQPATALTAAIGRIAEAWQEIGSTGEECRRPTLVA